jgi:hypothetical protein
MTECELSSHVSRFSESLSSFSVAALDRVLTCTHPKRLPLCEKAELDAEAVREQLTRTMEQAAAAIRQPIKFDVDGHKGGQKAEESACQGHSEEAFESALAGLVSRLSRSTADRVLSWTYAGVACGFPKAKTCPLSETYLAGETSTSERHVVRLLQSSAAHSASDKEFHRSLAFSFEHLLRRVEGEMHARYRCRIEGTRIASEEEADFVEGVGEAHTEP